jgi:hypothetical protein
MIGNSQGKTEISLDVAEWVPPSDLVDLVLRLVVRRDWNFTETKSGTLKLFHPYSRSEHLGRYTGLIADIVSCHGTIQSGCCH